MMCGGRFGRFPRFKVGSAPSHGARLLGMRRCRSTRVRWRSRVNVASGSRSHHVAADMKLAHTAEVHGLAHCNGMHAQHTSRTSKQQGT